MTEPIELPDGRRLLVVEDGEALAAAAAERFVATTTAAVAARGRAIVALSGGSTPKKMGELLARPEFAGRVPWGETDLFWGDERWVPLASSESNAGEARRAFLDAVPAPPERIHPVATDLASPVRAAEAYEAEIRRVAGTAEGIPVFDLVLLGMGDDGHTASLFPGTAALHERDRLVVENFVPKLGVDRITFTYPLLAAAREVLVLVGGAGKADTLARVLEGPTEPEGLPSQSVRVENGTLTWLVDRAAAGSLRSAGQSG
ncbi:MAG: 6-phosphogluconolactonase, eukaryotic type [uncultured Thermomicrobiales bacterium]|uniref:6-phosphogluconolactonase n=1 Tax=uncultured Thermomicrobiales bacterium TaxID=1645740 RepID=A0A6J4VQX5_9BACT|nr:MAG: 6-phosphogluconolactonase, eukaryotic type [uncultured Thermomicrobiales bacterium]